MLGYMYDSPLLYWENGANSNPTLLQSHPTGMNGRLHFSLLPMQYKPVLSILYFMCSNSSGWCIDDHKRCQQGKPHCPGSYRCDSQEEAESDVDQGRTSRQLVWSLPDDPLQWLGAILVLMWMAERKKIQVTIKVVKWWKVKCM